MQEQEDTPAPVVVIEVHRCNQTGSIQISIGDEHGGYRIAGLKFLGDSELLQRRRLTVRDRDEIRRYLDQVRPEVVTDGEGREL
jgi:hypothetical protein